MKKNLIKFFFYVIIILGDSMKIIINKNTPKDTLYYLKDILEGISKRLKNTKNKEERKKVLASLLIITSLITGGTIINNKSKDAEAATNDQIIEVEIPVEIDVPEPTIGPVVNSNNIQEEVVINARNNIGEPETVEDAIKLYTDIFEVKEDLVSPIVMNAINENPNFYEDYTLDGTTYPNLHEAIFFKVLDIVYNPGKYDYNTEELKSNIDWDTELKAEELTYIFSEYFDINPFFAMSIEYTECGGNMDSYDWTYNNNPAGIGPHNKFRNKATGVIYLCYLLKNSYNIDINSGINELNNMASTYCTSGTDTWIRLTNGFYNELTENGYLYKRQNDDTSFIINDMTYNQYISNTTGLTM